MPQDGSQGSGAEGSSTEDASKELPSTLSGLIFRQAREDKRILTAIDYVTRYPEAADLKSISTEAVAETLVDMYSRVGIPEEISTGMGIQLVSECMWEVSRLLKIRQLSTTFYHPICNSLVEKFNGTLKSMFRRLRAEQPRQWHRYI